MEEPLLGQDILGLCTLMPHPVTLPHYITPRDGIPALCPFSEQVSRQHGKGWAGMPKRKAKKVQKRVVKKRVGENRQQARARERAS